MELADILAILREWALPLLGAIIIPIITILITRRKKSFSYEIKNISQLLKIHKEVKGKIQILYEGMPVNDAYLISLKFRNDGNEPIRKNDIEVPIECKFDDDVKILSYDIIQKKPEDLECKLSIEDNKIIWDPATINQKNFLMLNMIVSNYINSEENPKVTGRIVGADITEITHETQKDKSRKKYGIILSYIGLIIYFIYPKSLDYLFISSSIIIVGFVIFFFPKILRIFDSEIEISIS